MKAFLLRNCNGKAIVTEYDDGSAELTSYKTVVAAYMWGKLYRTAGQPQSNTTAKHMREFAMFYGLPYMTKAELSKLPIR